VSTEADNYEGVLGLKLQIVSMEFQSRLPHAMLAGETNSL
jgi:hypothetical protein